MPVYDYKCPNGHTKSYTLKHEDSERTWPCLVCDEPMAKQFPIPAKRRNYGTDERDSVTRGKRVD